MTEPTRLDAMARGWRGRVLAALIALVAGLPGMIFLPVADRDEARYAQVAAQMLESGDFVGVNFQDQAINREPVLVHWLEAASVALVSSSEARSIWAYRIPSLLGAMLAAAACAWGAEALFGAVPGLIAGAMLGATMGLATAAGFATADAALAGASTLSMAAFARIYAAGRGEVVAGVRTKVLFWGGLGLAILGQGLVAPAIAVLTGVALAIWDRRAPRMRTLGWTWGLLLIAAIVGPWAVAITIRTDGGVWAASRLSGRYLPGLQLLLAPLLLFPFAVLLPPAAVEGWKGRAETGVRFALAWLVPAWVVFELLPGRPPISTLPLYGAVAWLAAFALTRPLGVWSRWAGVGLSLAVGIVLAVGVIALAVRFGGASALGLATLAAILLVLAGAAGAAVLLSPRGLSALVVAGALGVIAHAVVFAAVLPGLSTLWTSDEVSRALDRAKLNPQDGLTPGPVTAVGFSEPSLIFRLGTETAFGDVDDAAAAISEGGPAVIDDADDAAFQAELATDKLSASPAGAIAGFDYSRWRPVRLTIYRSNNPPQPSTP